MVCICGAGLYMRGLYEEMAHIETRERGDGKGTSLGTGAIGGPGADDWERPEEMVGGGNRNNRGSARRHGVVDST
jgi:hypothetical protein